ncbi:FadR/GntR family transcriptional regulator [Tumebacillus lipolyticus]|uniref:FadR/GntR family transcriptional regulator n=1 Tax=Tumebacillus lipolyticus TaxID=1280370 RepID=A0ABW4ZYP6_9BACL
MTLQRAVRSSLVKQVVEQLESFIETGKWQIGARIPAEPELVNQLGVSRNTIREAVQALIHTGMLEARQGDGTYVRRANQFEAAMLRRLERSTVAETLEARHCLEREIARLAAMRRTEEDLRAIRSCLAERDREDQHTDSFVEADFEFHIMIATATHNSVLIDLYKHMSESLRMSISSTVGDAEWAENHRAAHHALVDAIAAQDAIAAEEAASKLVQASQDAWVRQER